MISLRNSLEHNHLRFCPIHIFLTEAVEHQFHQLYQIARRKRPDLIDDFVTSYIVSITAVVLLNRVHAQILPLLSLRSCCRPRYRHYRYAFALNWLPWLGQQQKRLR